VEYMPPLVHLVEEKDDGLPLIKILRNRMQVSRSLLSKLKMTERGIEVNGKRVYTNTIVHTGDCVELRMVVEQSDDILPEPIPFAILFEDEHLLVVNKASGIIVHPTHGHYTGTLANGVVYYWREQGQSYRFRPIHRLDQDTSGVLAIAKSAYVHQHVSEQMKNNQVEKAYLAYVHGIPSCIAGTVDAPIDRSDEHPHIRVVRDDGYASITHYETIATFGTAVSLQRIKLETGRTHQIRVHMKHIGHPLLGDAMYGPTETNLDILNQLHHRINRHALHAESLSFTHPILGERLTFTAPLPEDLFQLSNYLKLTYVERK
jgi:23S rRNA pseudouridine1911/1915/1917 synthase